MFVVLVLVAAAAILAGIGAVAAGRGRRFDDVERFHRARAMTTSWARAGVTRPLLVEQEVPEREPGARVDA